jgi:hypothetical protein
MKKIFTAIAIIAFAATSSVFAADASNVSTKIKDAFANKFEGAKNINWKTNVNFVKATFELKGELVEAFYGLDGNIIGTSRSISLQNLPLDAQNEMDKKYSGYKTTESIVFEGVEETVYYVSLENEKQAVILKITAEGETSIYKKTKKK